ncbi:hypothetical protein, partial [Staphylococcus aureus]
TTTDDEVPEEGEQLAAFSGTQIVRDDVGTYHVTLAPEHTAERGNITAIWAYTVGGRDVTYTDYLQITEQMPVYDALRPEEKA